MTTVALPFPLLPLPESFPDDGPALVFFALGFGLGLGFGLIGESSWSSSSDDREITPSSKEAPAAFACVCVRARERSFARSAMSPAYSRSSSTPLSDTRSFPEVLLLAAVSEVAAVGGMWEGAPIGSNASMWGGAGAVESNPPAAGAPTLEELAGNDVSGAASTTFLYAGLGRGLGRGAEELDADVEIELSASLECCADWMLEGPGRGIGLNSEMLETTDRSTVKLGVWIAETTAC